jgi:hypothetical protein
MTSGAGTQCVTGNEWNNKDYFFSLYLLPKDVHGNLSNHEEVLVLRLLREIIFCNCKWNMNKPKKIKINIKIKIYC